MRFFCCRTSGVEVMPIMVAQGHQSGSVARAEESAIERCSEVLKLVEYAALLFVIAAHYVDAVDRRRVRCRTSKALHACTQVQAPGNKHCDVSRVLSPCTRLDRAQLRLITCLCAASPLQQSTLPWVHRCRLDDVTDVRARQILTMCFRRHWLRHDSSAKGGVPGQRWPHSSRADCSAH